jgi:hypothetical protein
MDNVSFPVDHSVVRRFEVFLSGLSSRKLPPKELRSTTSDALLHVAGVDASPSGNPHAALLGLLAQPLEITRKGLFVACLLRLLTLPSMRWLVDGDLRRLVIELLEDHVGPTLYLERPLTSRGQTHKKADEILRLTLKLEQDYLAALVNLSSLEGCDQQRRNLLKALGRPLAPVMIGPFLPAAARERITEIYRRVFNYSENHDDPSLVLEAYEQADRECTQFEEELTALATHYSFALRDGMAARIKELLYESIVRNTIILQAALRVEFRNKKYPLHNVGEEIDIGFAIRNDGPGFAYDIVLFALADENVTVLNNAFTLQRLAPSEGYSYELKVKLGKYLKTCELAMQVQWRDFDGGARSVDVSFVAEAQKAEIRWTTLAQTDPYSLEPVTREQDLVGRTDVLNRLLGILGASSVGSCIIRGQKRVGKTSIARVLEGRLPDTEFISFYLEGGDYVNPSATIAIQTLGAKIAQEIRSRDRRAAALPTPMFGEALAPLADFLDQALAVITEKRLVIVLDEFDRLPVELYARGPLGDAFFLTLRSLTSRARVGFIVVGGEEIAYILASQGFQVNKWTVIAVDYFDREEHWSDYKELVQRPTSDTLEFSDGAFTRLHMITAGNPYFTKLICQHIFRDAVEKRDAHITEVEVERAANQAAAEADVNTFAHFWDDGLFVTGEAAAEKSVTRRRVMVAVSEAVETSTDGAALLQDIRNNRLVQGVNAIDAEVMELAARGILVGVSDKQKKYRFNVDLFRRWLQRRGVRDVLLTFSEVPQVLHHQLLEEDAYEGKIRKLVAKWPAFRSKNLTADDVRSWLLQFGGLREQRSMLRLLQGLRFYDREFTLASCRYTNLQIRRVLTQEENVVRQVGRDKRKGDDILVCYREAGRCAAELARLYADESSIYVRNIVSDRIIDESLVGGEEIRAVVYLEPLVDDGNSAYETLARIAGRVRQAKGGGVRLFFFALVAFSDELEKIQSLSSVLGASVGVLTGEILDGKQERLFGPMSRTFPDEQERSFAKSVALTFGRLVDEAEPLGSSELGAAVVFDFGCPTGAVPLLGCRSAKWRPLFDDEGGVR